MLYQQLIIMEHDMLRLNMWLDFLNFSKVVIVYVC